MDPDDFDQYRRKSVKDAQTTEATKLHNLTQLRSSGLEFTESENGDMLIFRKPHKLTVEFITRRSRWRVRGKPKTYSGSVGQFEAFLKQLWGVDPHSSARRDPNAASGLGTFTYTEHLPETAKAFADPKVREGWTRKDRQ